MTVGEWTGAEIARSVGREPPDVAEWTPVDVPGRPEQFAGADAVAYRTTFEDPRTGDETRAVLDLRGAFAHTRVWVNGELAAEHDAYFRPLRVPFEPEERNVVVVECRAPEDRFGGVYATDRVPESAAVPGIWWDASVETHADAFVDEFTVSPHLTESDAVIEARLTIDAASEVDDHVRFSVRPDGFRGGGMMEQAPVTARAGERVTVERTIEVRDPSAWWPAGRGPQHRYVVTAKFGDDERERTTGFSSVRRDPEGVFVNGRRARLRGFNVLPGGDVETDVERAAAANANVVRAHAHVPPHELHDACDEHGLLVWQDLPLTGPGGYDVERARTLAGGLVDEYDRHPSLGLFGVHDGPREPVSGDLGRGRTARYRLRWRTWRTEYNHSADDRVAEALPADAAVFPVVGGVGTDPDASAIFPGWQFGDADDAAWLLDRSPELGEVVGAFGAGAPADGEDADQTEQARTLKTVAETLRRRDGDALVAYALRDPAPADEVVRGSLAAGAGLGVLSADGDEKEGYAALSDSFEPVQAVLDGRPRRGDVGVTVLNDSPDAVETTVSWECGEERGSEDVAVDALDRADAGQVTVPGDAETVELSLSVDGRRVTNAYRL